MELHNLLDGANNLLPTLIGIAGFAGGISVAIMFGRFIVGAILDLQGRESHLYSALPPVSTEKAKRKNEDLLWDAGDEVLEVIEDDGAPLFRSEA